MVSYGFNLFLSGDPVKCIIAGSRDAQVTMKMLKDCIYQAGFPITEVVSGNSGNVDKLGEQWGLAMHLPVTQFNAAWQTYGASAGPRRNRQMAEYADALIALWDGKSKGTFNMIKEATKRELSVYVMNV
jgi:hypothetical protein